MISRVAEIAFFTVWSAVTVLTSYWLGQQAYGWMPPQATKEAVEIDHLFSFLVTLGAVIFLGIFGMIAHAVVTCRAAPGDFSEGHPARGSNKLEVLWTAVPTLLVLWVAVQGYQIYDLLDIRGLAIARSPLTTAPAYAAAVAPPAQPLETIEVTAKQWAWSFYYPDQKVTSTDLHLPRDRRIRLALKSEDVLHGFYVPAFRIKQDIIPNRDIALVVSPSREGKYRLHDSQFSGAYFSLMASDVYVESPEAYQQWLSAAAADPNSTTKGFINRSADSAGDLAIAEHQNPPHLWGQHWAVNAPDAFLKSALKANAPSLPPNS